MQGEDINDSNCIDFKKISKIRDINKITKSDSQTHFHNIRIGVVDEFGIEELDERNNNIQDTVLKELIN